MNNENRGFIYHSKECSKIYVDAYDQKKMFIKLCCEFEIDFLENNFSPTAQKNSHRMKPTSNNLKDREKCD